MSATDPPGPVIPWPAPAVDTGDALNHACFCLSLDPAALGRALDIELGEPGLSDLVRQRAPYALSAQPVFVSAPHLQRITQVVRAVEEVVALPAFQQEVLAHAPASAQQAPDGPRGVFFGYDFHLNQGQLGLIEVNTNAGGAMLNAALARAQRACCEAVSPMVPSLQDVAQLEAAIVRMFRQEWQLAGQARPLQSVAIVDTAPQDQYLYAEFLLMRRLLQRHGLQVVIADPSGLALRDGRLWCGELPIDLVYNRLTDFYLDEPAHAALRQAYLRQAVVLTPNPRLHALYANKRHLAVFSDDARLADLGVAETTRHTLLASVPRTEVVEPIDADRLWAARRGLFFKPMAGYGSRAAYRGDKLTRRVWEEILQGDYIAQALVTPGERLIEGQEAPARAMKFDLRAYTYQGQVQWVAARIYQGQTTNFRTPGGGFAPVFSTWRAATPAPGEHPGALSSA